MAAVRTYEVVTQATFNLKERKSVSIGMTTKRSVYSVWLMTVVIGSLFI
jgi:hypothetical protein